MASARLTSLTTFLRARLSHKGYLGLHLTLGTLLMVVAAWVFSGIADAVSGAEMITIIDVDIANWLHSHANPSLTKFMLAITYMHSVAGIIVLSFFFAIVIIWKKEWYWLSALTVTVGGGMLINLFVKHAFHRKRPSFDDPLLLLTTYSFPSGHTAGATLFYGALTTYLFYHIHSWRWRDPIVAIAVLMVLAVGVSRLYLGVHYLSDVLAAIAESTAWLAFSLTTISTLRRRKETLSLKE